MDEHIFDKVHEVDLKKTMEDSYIDYAMSVIAARALPDVRDGLKPVQRRILLFNERVGTTDLTNLTENVHVSSVIPWVNIIHMVTQFYLRSTCKTCPGF